MRKGILFYKHQLKDENLAIRTLANLTLHQQESIQQFEEGHTLKIKY